MRVRYGGYQGFRMNAIWGLIIANLLVFIIVFIVSRIAPQLALMLVAILALPPPDYFLAQPWTIVTSMFLHIEFWHIFGNMITLYFFGSYVSRLIGEKKFLLIYFGGGILGNIFLLLLAIFSHYNLAFGASGAVYAVAGVLVMLRPNLRVLLYFVIPLPLWVVIGVFFVIFSFLPFVAWQAHLGGLLLGLVAGYFFKKRARYFIY